VDVPPFPKFQLYEYEGVPPVALPEKFTMRGAVPEVGDAEAEATSWAGGGGGGGGDVTVMETELFAFVPWLSVTVSEAV